MGAIRVNEKNRWNIEIVSLSPICQMSTEMARIAYMLLFTIGVFLKRSLTKCQFLLTWYHSSASDQLVCTLVWNHACTFQPELKYVFGQKYDKTSPIASKKIGVSVPKLSAVLHMYRLWPLWNNVVFEEITWIKPKLILFFTLTDMLNLLKKKMVNTGLAKRWADLAKG